MEAYSAQMLAAVRHQVQQASVCQLLEMLRYFRQRKEIKARWARRRLNYLPTQTP
jgi:hypothetical protein